MTARTLFSGQGLGTLTVALAIGLGFAGGCSTGLEVSVETPAIEGLAARLVPFRFRGNWGAHVTAALADEGAVLARNTRVPFSVTTESGDSEAMLLRPAICESETGDAYQCLEFLFSMAEGHHVEEVADRMDEIDGDLRYVAYTGWLGTAAIFDGDVDRAVRTVRAWPGVASADRAGFSYLHALNDVQGRQLGVFIRVEVGDPVVGDGTLQARAGEQVTVTYDAPQLPVLTTGFVMCEYLATGEVLSEYGLGEMPPCE